MAVSPALDDRCCDRRAADCGNRRAAPWPWRGLDRRRDDGGQPAPRRGSPPREDGCGAPGHRLRRPARPRPDLPGTRWRAHGISPGRAPLLGRARPRCSCERSHYSDGDRADGGRSLPLGPSDAVAPRIEGLAIPDDSPSDRSALGSRDHVAHPRRLPLRLVLAVDLAEPGPAVLAILPLLAGTLVDRLRARPHEAAPLHASPLSGDRINDGAGGRRDPVAPRFGRYASFPALGGGRMARVHRRALLWPAAPAEIARSSL